VVAGLLLIAYRGTWGRRFLDTGAAFPHRPDLLVVTRLSLKVDHPAGWHPSFDLRAFGFY
jgi:hypothetical protein